MVGEEGYDGFWHEEGMMNTGDGEGGVCKKLVCVNNIN